jgi:hypothetical protein
VSTAPSPLEQRAQRILGGLQQRLELAGEKLRALDFEGAAEVLQETAQQALTVRDLWAQYDHLADRLDPPPPPAPPAPPAGGLAPDDASVTP